MQIEHEVRDHKGAFFIQGDGVRLAEMTYVMSGPSLMIIDHTEVSPALKGQGAGKRLVRAGVDFARESALKIVPLCPFAKAEFQKNQDYADVYMS